MFLTKPKPETQAEINAATLRTMVDLPLLCNAQSVVSIERRPFRLNTNYGAWTGAFLLDMSGALAVECELSGDVISTNTRIGRDLSWLLKSVGTYARERRSLSEFDWELRERQEDAEVFVHNGWDYQPELILNIFRALGAPDSLLKIGHFTHSEPILGIENPQVLALTGTVARAQWRAFLLPSLKRLEFLDNREGSLGEVE